MKFPIALLALLSTSGAYAHQGIRGSTTQDLKFLEGGDILYSVADGSKATIINCGPGGPAAECTIFHDADHTAVCSFSNPSPSNPSGSALDGGVSANSGSCAFLCTGGCKMTGSGVHEMQHPSTAGTYFDEEDEELTSEDYALDSFDEVAEE